MSEGKTLTVKQQAAVRSLLTNPSVRIASTAAGVAERTVYRWLEEPLFQAALDAGQDAALDAATRGLVALCSSALVVVQKALVDPLGKPSSKLRAAEIVFNNVLRLVELRDLSRRVAALEETNGKSN